MITVTDSDLGAIRPYLEDEYRAGLDRLLRSPASPSLARAYFPGMEPADFAVRAQQLKTIDEFQSAVISPAIDAMLAQSSRGLTISGLEHLDRARKCLFISNHRDIILDPALLTYKLCSLGYGTPKICLGDNLLSSPLIIDLIKMNKGVTVKRDLAPRELLRWSHALSELIYRSIVSGEDSVWIAQKEGRTKDGNDLTHPGVLKMLAMSGHGTFTECMAALHLVPVAISYEYDPCDVFKAQELHLTAEQGHYVKASDEDQRSMIAGIRGEKGRIHVSIGAPLSREIEQASALPMKKDQIVAVSHSIDRQVHGLYRLWPSNYIAADMLNNMGAFSAHYSAQEEDEFIERMEKRLLDHSPAVRARFIEAYARPVLNAQSRI